MAKKRDKEVNLSEKFSSLINAKPAFNDEDDEDLTKIDDIAPDKGNSDSSADELDLVQFRKLNIEFLDAEDSKYSGKRSSRIEHAKAFGSDSSDVEESTDENVDQPQFSKYSESEDTEDDNQSVEDESVKGESEGDRIQLSAARPESSNAEGETLNTDIFKKSSEDVVKGNAIRNQLLLWDLLLECRMKFQKSLSSSNQLPRFHQIEKFTTSGGEEFKTLLSITQDSLKHLLNSFLELQDVLLQKNDDYRKCTAKHGISSDDEEGEEREGGSKTKKMKLSDFSSEIESRHKQMETFRNETIQKWNDKTRITHVSSKNFSAFEQSTLKQIEHVLLDKQRLIKRTQVKRSNYHILGQSQEEEDEECPPKKQMKFDESESSESKKADKKICKEIFDDDDFYHQLLSEYVKQKSSNISDPVELSKQWIQLEKIRSKMKKKVDTRATKGRKIRYVVHQKLVNFMMPIENVYNEGSRTELFNSIFGKNQKL